MVGHVDLAYRPLRMFLSSVQPPAAPNLHALEKSSSA